MLEIKKTLAIATLLCTVTATSALAGDGPMNGAEALDALTLEETYEIEEAVDHIDPAVLDSASALDNGMRGGDEPDHFDADGFVPMQPTRAGSEKTHCQNQAVLCATESVGTALACAATILSPFTAGLTAVGCIAGLASGGDTCAEVNNVCNVGTGNHSTTQTTFAGTTNGSNSTKVCGSPDRVRRAYFWWDTHHSWGITVISKIRLYCTDGGSMTFGNNNGNSNGGWGSYCNENNLIQGFDVRYGSKIDGAAPRCDQVDDTTSGDWIGSWRGGMGGTFTTMQCPEGRYTYGMRAFYDNGPNADVNYINGFNLLCRP